MSVLVISKHDFRSLRKANLHFIATEFLNYGAVRFFSTGFSALSKYNGDPRIDLDKKSGVLEVVDGVECYLHKTLIHPFRFPFAGFNRIEKFLFDWFSNTDCKLLTNWIIGSEYIVIESGFPVALLPKIYKINPAAKVIYIASDDLVTIGCSVVLEKILNSYKNRLFGIRIPSKSMAKTFDSSSNVYYVPHGFKTIGHDDLITPYVLGQTSFVSVGSMLFDKYFFEVASAAYPQIDFHIIGDCGDLSSITGRKNVIYHGEMAYGATLAYIKYANAGIAPYKMTSKDYYLADTSMKLMQYDYFGLPSICPKEACGNRSNRFGYEVGNPKSIEAAISGALACKEKFEVSFFSWADVADRILYPSNYSDTKI